MTTTDQDQPIRIQPETGRGYMRLDMPEGMPPEEFARRMQEFRRQWTAEVGRAWPNLARAESETIFDQLRREALTSIAKLEEAAGKTPPPAEWAGNHTWLWPEPGQFEEMLSPAARAIYGKHPALWNTVIETREKSGERFCILAEPLAVVGEIDEHGQPRPADLRRLAEAVNRGVEAGVIGWGALLPITIIRMEPQPRVLYVLYAYRDHRVTREAMCAACGLKPPTEARDPR